MLLTLPFTTPALLPSVYTTPLFRAEWAPGKHPLDPPASSDWTPLLINGESRLVSCSSNTGRQDDLNSFEPLSATLVLDGSDGELDESDPTSLVATAGAGLPFTPVRVTASLDNGSTYHPIFTGFVDQDGWRPSGAPGDPRRRATVQLTDWLGWAKTRKMPLTRWDWWVASNSPDAWITGKTDEGILDGTNFPFAVAYDDGESAGHYSMTAVGASVHITQAASIVTGNSDDEASLLLTTSDYLDSQNDLPTTDNTWTVAFWFKQPATATNHVLVAGHLLGVMRWSVSIASSGNIFATTYDTSGNSDTVAVSAVHDDGSPHLVIASWNATTQIASIRTDLGSNTAPWFVGTLPWRGSGGTLRIGDAGAAVYADEQVQDVAYFGGKDLYQSLTNPDDLYYFTGAVVNMATVVSGADHIGALLFPNAVAFLLDAARVGTATYSVDKTTLYDRDILNRTPIASDLAAGMVELADADRGAVYVLRDGTVRFRDVAAVNSLTKYVDPIITLTDEPTAASLYGGKFLRATARSRTGRRVDRVINYVTQPRLNEGSAAATWTQRAATSIQRYGQRQLDLTCRGYFFDYDARPSDYYGDGVSNEASKGRTQSILDQYEDPPIEIGTIELKPARSIVDAVFAIKDLELEVPLTYVETGLINDDFRVQAIRWDCTNGRDWTVSIQIAPIVISDVSALVSASSF